jgi:hypothetical protein
LEFPLGTDFYTEVAEAGRRAQSFESEQTEVRQQILQEAAEEAEQLEFDPTGWFVIKNSSASVALISAH